MSALASYIASAIDGPLRVACKAPMQKSVFGDFCRVAFAWGRVEPCLIVVEELAWVTDPGKAPGGWLELVTGGLKYGIDIMAITQRPSESDKTSLSQADVVACFQMERVNDQKYMAGELGVDVARVAGLEPLHYIRKDRRARTVSDDVVRFPA